MDKGDWETQMSHAKNFRLSFFALRFSWKRGDHAFLIRNEPGQNLIDREVKISKKWSFRGNEIAGPCLQTVISSESSPSIYDRETSITLLYLHFKA